MSIPKKIMDNIGVISEKGLVSHILFFLRGVCALVVVINHIRMVFLVEFTTLDNPNLLIKILYFIANLGHPAVMVFFLLSGLHVGSNVLKKILTKSWSWKNYLIQRLTRLYVVLIPALIITSFLDYFGMSLFGEQAYLKPWNFIENMNLHTFFGNLFFLQGIFVNTYATNGPLWSLSYEFWYYILFPVIALCFTSKRRISKFLYSLGALVLLVFIGKEIAMYFLIWLLGIAVVFIPGFKIRPGKYGYLLYALSFILLITALKVWSQIRILYFADIIVAVVSILFIYFSMHLIKNTSGNILFKQLSTKLAGFSYTLYLSHNSVLIFIYAWYISIGGKAWEPSAKNLFYSMCILLVVVVYSYLISLITEQRTEKLRNVMNILFQKKWTFRPKQKAIIDKLSDAHSK